MRSVPSAVGALEASPGHERRMLDVPPLATSTVLLVEVVLLIGTARQVIPAHG